MPVSLPTLAFAGRTAPAPANTPKPVQTAPSLFDFGSSIARASVAHVLGLSGGAAPAARNRATALKSGSALSGLAEVPFGPWTPLLRQAAAMQKVGKDVARAPVLGAAMAKPRFAAVAHADTQPLAHIETTYEELNRHAREAGEVWSGLVSGFDKFDARVQGISVPTLRARRAKTFDGLAKIGQEAADDIGRAYEKNTAYSMGVDVKTLRKIRERNIAENEKNWRNFKESYQGASLIAGGHDLAAMGATLADNRGFLNPTHMAGLLIAKQAKDMPTLRAAGLYLAGHLSQHERLELYADDPEMARYVVEHPTFASRFADEQHEQAEASVAHSTDDDAKRRVYFTLDPNKSAFGSWNRISGDLLRGAPTTAVALLAAAPTGGASIAVAVAATAGTQFASGYGQQYNQTKAEIMARDDAAMKASPEYNDLLARGFHPGVAKALIADRTAHQGAMTAGAIDAVIGTIGGPVAKKVLGEAGNWLVRGARGVASEAVQNSVNNAADQVAVNAAKKAHVDPAQDLLENAGESAVASLPMAAIGAKDAFRRRVNRQARAEAASQAAAHMETLSEASFASQTRHTSPDDFQSYVRDVAAKGTVKDVYVDARVLHQSMNTPEGRATLEKMPKVAAQVAAAVRAGQDVRVPVEDFAAHFSDPGTRAAIADHIKTDPDGMTRAQSRDALAKLDETTRADFEAAMKGAEDGERLRQSAETVKARIKADIDATGIYQPHASNLLADIAARTYAVRAARAGRTAEDAYARNPLRVVAEPAPDGQAVHQRIETPHDAVNDDGTLTLHHWSLSGDVAASDPHKWGENIPALTREERNRIGAAPARTYFGIGRGRDGGYRKEHSLGEHLYSTTVPVDRLYDYAGDPLHIGDEARRLRDQHPGVDLTSLKERLIQQKGYLGYWLRGPGRGTYAAVFDSLPLNYHGLDDGKSDGHSLRQDNTGRPDRAGHHPETGGLHDGGSLRPGDDRLDRAAGTAAGLRQLRDGDGVRPGTDPVDARPGSGAGSDALRGAGSARTGAGRLDGAPQPETESGRLSDAGSLRPGAAGLDGPPRQPGHGEHLAGFESRARSLKDAIEAEGGDVIDTMQVEDLGHSRDIPIITLKDLIGTTIMGTYADRTAAAALFHGIDASKTDPATPLPGGVFAAADPHYREKGVVWMVRGKSVATAMINRAKGGAQHMLILLGGEDMHQSNLTFSAAYYSTIYAYLRDGRMTQADAARLTDLIRKGSASDANVAASLRAFPGFGSKKKLAAYVNATSFETRRRIMSLMNRQSARDLGVPSIRRALDETRERGLAGHRTGDGVLVVRIDPTRSVVELGSDGIKAHPDYPYGIQGEVVGRLKEPVSKDILWHDWLEDRRADAAAKGQATKGPLFDQAFARAQPAVAITPELVARVGDLSRGRIQTARQARLVTDAVLGRWRESGKSHKHNGVSVNDFIQAQRNSPARASLTEYTAAELKKGIRDKTIRLFQLGDDGHVFFMLKKGEDGRQILTSVINNEPGARGIGAEAIVLKALEAGATHLDCFAVKSDKFPKGFLPRLYGKFGFAETGSGAFDPSAFRTDLPDAERKRALADLKHFWATSTPGHTPARHGEPQHVSMKWSGSDADRANLTQSYYSGGLKGLLGGRTSANVADYARNSGYSDRATPGGGGPAADDSRTGRPENHGDGVPLVADARQDARGAVSGTLSGAGAGTGTADGPQQRGGQGNAGGDDRSGPEGQHAGRTLGNARGTTDEFLRPDRGPPAGAGTAADRAGTAGNQAAGDEPHAGRAGGVVRDIAGLSDTARLNLGLSAEDQAAVRDRIGWSPDSDGGGTLRQGARGSFSPRDLTIRLHPDADLSTFLHELGHFNLHLLMQHAVEPDAPPHVIADARTILREYGGDDSPGALSNWHEKSLDGQRDVHEQFARGFERYLMEGKAPTPQLRSAFETFRKWLVDIYRHVANLRVSLSDEVRGVMDRMVATEAEIDAATTRRGLDLPDDMPEGMDADAWVHARTLSDAATEAAHTQLQARALRDMQWIDFGPRGAKGRELRRLQSRVAGLRETMRAEVAAEVAAEPVNQARDYLRGQAPLDLTAVRAAVPEAAAARLDGMTAEGGLHPDMAAAVLGYDSGEALIRGLLNQLSPEDKIRSLTSERLLSAHGDLTDAVRVTRAADEAIFNETRIDALAATIVAADPSGGDGAALVATTRTLAGSFVDRQPAHDLRPELYAAASARAGEAAKAALQAGDTALAASELRKQLYNAQVARTAFAAQSEWRASEALFADVVAHPPANDMAAVAQALLAEFGYGAHDDSEKDGISRLAESDPQGLGDIEPFILQTLGAAPSGRRPRDISFADLRNLTEAINRLVALSQRGRAIRRDGVLVPLDSAAAEVATALKTELPPLPAAGLLTGEAIQAHLGRWARTQGPGVHATLIRPLADAIATFRQKSAACGKRLRQAANAIEATLTPGRIDAPELGYTFGAHNGGRGMADLIGALRHTGNAASLNTLLQGRGWAGGWDAFITRMHAEERLIQAHWDYVQAEWDLYAELTPQLQAAHTAVYGAPFKAAPAPGLQTPFGTYKGGFVAAIIDPRLADDMVIQQTANDRLGGTTGAFLVPAPTPGFHAAHAGALALDLDLSAQGLDTALRFATLAEPMRDLLRLTQAQPLRGKVPADVLHAWIDSANQALPAEDAGGRLTGKAMDGVRGNPILSALFGEMTKGPGQIDAHGLDAKALAGVALRPMRAPDALAREVAAASPLMSGRLKDHMARMAEAGRDALRDEAPWSKGHDAFLAAALSHAGDLTAWTAAYAKAVGSGASDPVAKADAMVPQRTEPGASIGHLLPSFAAYSAKSGNMDLRGQPANVQSLYWLGALAPALSAARLPDTSVLRPWLPTAMPGALPPMPTLQTSAKGTKAAEPHSLKDVHDPATLAAALTGISKTTAASQPEQMPADAHLLMQSEEPDLTANSELNSPAFEDNETLPEGSPVPDPAAAAEAPVSENSTRSRRKNWKKHLTRLKGPPPEWMTDPHAHHIVHQKGNGATQQALVLEGQEILRSAGIDPIDGPENLVWAPMRVKEQHAAAALEAVVMELRAAREMGFGREMMVKILKEHGDQAEKR